MNIPLFSPLNPNLNRNPREIRIKRKIQAAFTLLEILMYITVMGLVLAAATKLFFQAWDDHKALRRNADDIVLVLHAGEKWRGDVRAATGPMQLNTANGAEQLHIPCPAGEIVYTFANGQLRRQSGAGADRVILANVKKSEMQSDLRHDIPAWRWELELQTVKKNSQWRPYFTFESVAGGGAVK